MRVRSAWAVAIILVLVAPTVLAGEDGAFTFNGAAQVNGDSHYTMLPVGVYAPNATQLRSLTFRAPAVQVYRLTHECTEAATPVLNFCLGQDDDVASYRLTNVEVTLAGPEHPGSFGLYPSGGKLDLAGHTPSTVETRTHAEMGSPTGSYQPDPSEPVYRCCEASNLAVVSMAGSASYVGGGVLKIYGPTVRVQSAENTTTEVTGHTPESDAPARGVHEEALTLFFDTGNLTFTTDATFQAAGHMAQFAWTGGVTLPDATGDLSGDTGLAQAHHEQTVLEGAFTGTLQARENGASSIAISGRLDRTNLALAPASAFLPAPKWPAGWLVATALVSVLAAVVAVWLVARRRRPEDTLHALSADEFQQLADVAIEAGQPREALTWIRRARELAPTSTTLLLNEAHCLSLLGDVDGALALYEQASKASSDGEADLLAATLLASVDQPAERVADHLRRAFAVNPALVLEVQLDDTFDRLRAAPPVRRAIRDAMRRGGTA